MRWMIVVGVGLSALVAGGALMSRAFDLTREPAPLASEPGSPGSSAGPDDRGTLSFAPSSDDVPKAAVILPADEGPARSGEDPQALQDGLDQALQALHAAQTPGSRDDARGPRRAAVAGGPRSASMDTALDPSGLGPEAEALAQKLEPGLAREALGSTGQEPAGTPEIEHQLLETWKEQKQILHGERDTIDSVLNAAH